MTISSRPKELKLSRIKAGYSMRYLAMKASLNCATISTAEKCEREVTPRTAKAIADALGVPIESIFNIQVEKAGDTNASQNENN